MSAPTLASSPLVKNAFAGFIAGFPAGYFTSAKIPQAKVKKTEVHPAGSPVAIKVPSGLAEIEDMEIKGFQGTDGALDRSITEWSQQCAGVNRLGRATAKPLDAKRVVTVEQYDGDGTVVHRWKAHGAFLLEGGAIELEGGDENPAMRDMKLSVDWVEQVL